MNFDVISSTFKWFSKRTCRLYYEPLEKLFCEYAKNIIMCPSVQTEPSSLRYMITLISKYNIIISPNLYLPKFESGLIGNSKRRRLPYEKVSHSCTFTVLLNSSHHSVWEGKSLSSPVHKACLPSLKTT